MDLQLWLYITLTFTDTRHFRSAHLAELEFERERDQADARRRRGNAYLAFLTGKKKGKKWHHSAGTDLNLQPVCGTTSLVAVLFIL